MPANKQPPIYFRQALVLLMIAVSGICCAGTGTEKYIAGDDSVKTTGASTSALDKDEGIKCTRAELIAHEFTVICKEKYGEVLRITFQDLERGGREIIFQKKMAENDEVKFFMPLDLIKEAKTAVLIIMKGSGMFFKKIDITD
ncbi:MAG: hypothetical protein ACXVP0_03690 [Bacteroidia bacterium]